MVHITTSGSFDKTMKFLRTLGEDDIFKILDSYGQTGVDLLSSATPVETGETAGDWGYEVEHKKGRHALIFYNTHDNEGVNIAIIIQYGHGTGTGGYVEGIDYINPVIRPLFDKLSEEVWREVRNA